MAKTSGEHAETNCLDTLKLTVQTVSACCPRFKPSGHQHALTRFTFVVTWDQIQGFHNHYHAAMMQLSFFVENSSPGNVVWGMIFFFQWRLSFKTTLPGDEFHTYSYIFIYIYIC